MLTDLKHKDMEMVLKTAAEIQKTEIKLLDDKKKYVSKVGKTPKEILNIVKDRFGAVDVKDPHEELLKPKEGETNE